MKKTISAIILSTILTVLTFDSSILLSISTFILSIRNIASMTHEKRKETLTQLRERI